MTASNGIAQPPSPPEIQRRFRLYRWQWIGLPALLLIPTLALFGTFGESWAEAADASEELELRIKYSSRFRYKALQEMEVRVLNRSDRLLDTVTVAFDTAYITRFSTVTFTPDVKTAYEVELTDLLPGETRLITVGLQGESYWRHSGSITAGRTGSPPAEVFVSTFIFP